MKIALVSIGKIARDQHLPAIAASPDWDLAAIVSRNASVAGVEGFRTLGEMLAARPDIGAVSLCMPPPARFAPAAEAISAGRHVMLEKPPGATLSECVTLERMARAAGVSLFATWHSRMAGQVARAAGWLRGRRILRVDVVWKEDVRRWHPGQEWIWQPGGLGVFDPGINALSILTGILPVPLHVTRAVLDFPANRATPIAADLTFHAGPGAEARAVFDWREEGPQIWEIAVGTADGCLVLRDGGARLEIDGVPCEAAGPGEYPALYARMARLVAAGESEVDLAPMMLVADAFTLGERRQVAAFDW